MELLGTGLYRENPGGPVRARHPQTLCQFLLICGTFFSLPLYTFDIIKDSCTSHVRSLPKVKRVISAPRMLVWSIKPGRVFSVAGKAASDLVKWSTSAQYLS
jgi:hypothetical protein